MAESTALTTAEACDLRQRMCDGKVAHDYDGASRAAWAARHLRGEPVSAYPCPFCGNHVWHIGHAPNIERMALLARYLRFGATA